MSGILLWFKATQLTIMFNTLGLISLWRDKRLAKTITKVPKDKALQCMLAKL